MTPQLARRQARWILPRHDPSQIAEFARTLKIHPLAARILVSRGLDRPDTAARFLCPSLEHLHDPYLLTGMHQAVARVRRAIDSKEQILIYGDYDVDGTTSVVILKKAIELAGGSATFHVPHRLKEGYGMRTDVIERAAASGVRLVISVDTGIRSMEVVQTMRSLGLDVIVTDHHLPDAELPPALAVLNPNRTDCEYPDKNLCGAGVTFKLVHALLQTLDWPQERLELMLRSFLKLVAIATVADVVPLLGENRVIVKYGLHGLAKLRNHGLRALMEVSGLLKSGAPTAHQIAFQIAPRINAAGRMAHAEDVIHLFLTDDLGRARDLANQLHELNQERQQTEAEIVREILKQCELTPVTDDQAALVFSNSGWHRGVVGIVASRLVERFCRPVFVLSEEDEEVQGSGRSIPIFHLLEALESMQDLFTRFGGHRQAAGLGLRLGKVAEFRERLNSYARARLGPADFCPHVTVDAVASFAELNDDVVEQVLALAPFGFGNPAPVIVSMDAEIAAPPSLFKEKHLRFRFRQNGRYLGATAWNFVDRAGECLPGSPVDLAFALEEDTFGGNRGDCAWRAVLKDLRPAERQSLTCSSIP
jgi:single-stranded-DNA-specific exonuclease